MDALEMLSNLLARIHRDGGHFEAEHGTATATAEADVIVAKLNARVDVLEEENANLLHSVTAKQIQLDDTISIMQAQIDRLQRGSK